MIQRGGEGLGDFIVQANLYLPTCIEIWVRGIFRVFLIAFNQKLQIKICKKWKHLLEKKYCSFLWRKHKQQNAFPCWFCFTDLQTNLLLSSSSSISSGNADIYWIWASVPEQLDGARLSLPAAHEDTLSLQTWRPPSETTWIALSQLVRWIGTSVS